MAEQGAASCSSSIDAGQPGYSTSLDRDRDGVACEKWFLDAVKAVSTFSFEGIHGFSLS
jgi:hypothetical protein